MKNILMKQQQQTKKYHNNNNQLLSLLKPSSYSSNIHQKKSHSLYTKQSHVRPLIHTSSSSSSIFKQTSRSFVVLGGGGGDNNSGNNNKNTGDNKNVYGPKCKKCNSSMTFNGMYKDREDSRGFLYKCAHICRCILKFYTFTCTFIYRIAYKFNLHIRIKSS